jgi:hypothetical protein
MSNPTTTSAAYAIASVQTTTPRVKQLLILFKGSSGYQRYAADGIKTITSSQGAKSQTALHQTPVTDIRIHPWAVFLLEAEKPAPF